MKRIELEMLLQQIPPHPAPRADLEQYQTPATIAADILYEAHARGDIAGRRVTDLGCGTGIFAHGAALLGASESVGYDIDPAALKVAREAGTVLGIGTKFAECDICAVAGNCDTALLNPPFGFQKKGADRPFIEKAVSIAPVVYMLHHCGAREHIEAQVAGRASVTHEQRYKFTLKHTYPFHTREKRPVEASLFRLERVR